MRIIMCAHPPFLCRAYYIFRVAGIRPSGVQTLKKGLTAVRLRRESPFLACSFFHFFSKTIFLVPLSFFTVFVALPKTAAY